MNNQDNNPTQPDRDQQDCNPNRELFHKFGHFARLAHTWSAHQHGHKRGGPGRNLGTTRGQGRILAALKLKDGIATRELAYVLGIRVPSLNEALAKLEKSGHITRDADPRDRRVQLITLTDSGRKVADQLGQYETHTNIFEVLTAQERTNLSEYLDKLIARLHQELPELESGHKEWEKIARERMGDEGFEAWIACVRKRGGFGPFGGGFGDFDPRGFDARGFGGRGARSRRGPGEDFSSDFEGKNFTRDTLRMLSVQARIGRSFGC